MNRSKRIGAYWWIGDGVAGVYPSQTRSTIIRWIFIPLTTYSWGETNEQKQEHRVLLVSWGQGGGSTLP